MNSKIAIVGFGSAGRRHYSTAQESNPAAEFLVVTSNPGADLTLPHTSNLADVEKFKPHVVVLAGPASLRLETFSRLADHSPAFFFEKPLASSLIEGKQIMQHIATLGVAGQVGYNLRFSESLRFFRDHVSARRLGRILSVRVETGQFLPSWREGVDYRESVSGRSKLGGGVLLELSHELDFVQWIFGDISWVSGWIGKNSDLEIDVEDTAHISIGISRNDSSEFLIGTINLDFLRHDQVRLVTAICEQGSLSWDGVANEVKIHNANDHSWEVVWRSQPAENSYSNQWKSFLHSIESGSAPEVTVEDGLKVLKTIDAIRSSHEENGRRIWTEDSVDNQ